MGLKVSYFYKLTPRNYYNISEGYRKKEEDALKIKMTLNRDLEFAIVSPYLDNKKHPKNYSACDWKPFEWENEDEGAVVLDRVLKTKEELAAISQKMESENQS